MSDRDIIGYLSNEPTITGQMEPQIVISGTMEARFPASVYATSPILLDRSGANYTFSFDMNAVLEAVNLKADKATTVSAGTGLTGGGDLSANRSLALDSASIASLGKADTAVQSVVAGTNVTIDNTDPLNPIINASGSGGGGDVAGDTHAASSKSTPVDADELPLVDSAASWGLKKLTWADLKTALASTFLTPSDARRRLSADRTYYVATTGSDSNDGLSSGSPFLTVQHAVDVALSTLDFYGFTVTIQLADGTYTGATNVANGVGILAASKFVIRGNASSPGNVIVNVTSGNCFSAVSGGVFLLQDMELKNTTSGVCIMSSDGSYVEFKNIRFGSTPANHMTTTTLGRIKAVGNYSIVGGANYHAQVGSGSIRNSNMTVTLTGTPAFGAAFALAERGGVFDSFSVTYSGSATGVKHVVTSGGIIYTNGAGANYLPGSVNGTTGTTTGGGFVV